MWISSFLSLPEIIQWKDNNNSIIIFNAAKSRSVYFSLVKRYFLGFAFILCSIEWSNGWFVFDNVYIIGCWLDYIYIYIFPKIKITYWSWLTHILKRVKQTQFHAFHRGCFGWLCFLYIKAINSITDPLFFVLILLS